MSESRSPRTALERAPGFVVKSIKRRLVDRYYDRYFGNRPDHHALSRDVAAAAAREAEAVLFLCWGNICRSPFAERYLRARLDEYAVEGITVRSAGWGEYAGRASPEDAVASAARFGIDLGDHRSRRLSAELVRATDVVFVMDFNDFHAISRGYSDASTEAVFLRSFLGDASETPQIPDPHERGREQFDRTYGEIGRAIDQLVKEIRRDRPPVAAGGE